MVTERHPWFLASPTPRVLAHRGFVPPDAEGVTENSLAAIAAAHGAGAVYVESDCHLTSDGLPVLFHDADLLRVTGDPRHISDVTARELELIMSDRGGLATLPQVFETFPTLRFNLDVKADAAAVPVGRAIARYAERALITSFSDERRLAALAAAAAVRPSARPATSGGSATVARLLRALLFRQNRAVSRVLNGIDALQVPERQGPIRIVSPRLRDALHAAGVELHVWTVNEPDDMIRLLASGVDGLVTDRADLALRIASAWIRP